MAKRVPPASNEARDQANTLIGSKNYARKALTVYAIYAQETRPPNGAQPIDWLLLTSQPVETLQHAHALLGRYRNRWEIEAFPACSSSSAAWKG